MTHGFALNATVALCDPLGIPKYGLLAVLAITNVSLFGAALFYGVERFSFAFETQAAELSSPAEQVA